MLQTSSSQGDKLNEDNEFLKNVSAIPKMSYEDLKEATNNWSESNLLGRGGFGQVFKGPEACLVYQLMGGGSLEQRLRMKTHHPPLTWTQRYNIAHGVARGLQFLHTMAGTPLIHGDIKPANILLDTCLMPKIGDFGLARKGPYGDDRTHVKVSNYGVVVVEMATALPANDKTRPEQFLSMYIHQLYNRGLDMATLEDPVLLGTNQSNPAMCLAFIAIGLHCTKYARHQRPTMLEVYKKLNDMKGPNICT
ncbi:hypothetical protein HF086_011305 [Spodoptera exigua]|uniref:Protein kinase domain-containing protein n=1 Tax=Spodoptera exigua TaxID=7107 RepID=A0A922MF58_SPOEX|nr:hypothetical protein HF086_011305 [Spodoptera exigua]